MRRLFLHGLASIVVVLLSLRGVAPGEAGEGPRVATFFSDITPPLGAPPTACDPLSRVQSPLLAKGVVLEADGRRYVLCALDWCTLSNGSHEALRERLASAAGAEPARVAVQCLHQHTAPMIDLDVWTLLADAGAADLHVEPKVVETLFDRLTAAVRQSLGKLEPFDRIGTGQAKVDRVASARRCFDQKGILHTRWSTCKDPAERALPEGTIDPYVKTITFARGHKPLVRLHYYATHPQTSSGDGIATSDIVGDAREELQRGEHVFQVYFSGCAGDIGVGKYNDGSQQSRSDLAGRLLAGMKAAVAATKLTPAGAICWRTYPLLLPARSDPGFTAAECLARLNDPKRAPVLKTNLEAFNLAYYRRSGRPIEVSSLEMGNVHIVHLPGEPMICFQLFAQGLKPADFVAVAGYGDGGPSYICSEQAFREGGYEPSSSCTTAEADVLMKRAIAALLAVPWKPNSPNR